MQRNLLRIEMRKLGNQRCSACHGYGHAQRNCATHVKLSELQQDSAATKLMIASSRKKCEDANTPNTEKQYTPKNYCKATLGGLSGNLGRRRTRAERSSTAYKPARKRQSTMLSPIQFHPEGLGGDISLVSDK